MKPDLIVGLLIILVVCQYSNALAVLKITVNTVNTPNDVMELADLRFTEWISNESDQRNIPSIAAFRMATAEIQKERSERGAFAFLARIGGDSETVVGAAELSPIELEGALRQTYPSSLGRGNYALRGMYVTDVVTSREHRRKGVGQALMRAVEKHALVLGASHLFLHVMKQNTAALDFYRNPMTLGYESPPSYVLESLDTDRLAQNAGTVGQILLSKALVRL